MDTDIDVTDGDAWREHALGELLPLWSEHAPDEEYGGFHQALSREWDPIEPYAKIPAMMSRYVFAFSSAYLLSGDDEHLRQASRGVDYVLEHGWDEEYGGWYEELTREGEPKETLKGVQHQLYTNVGLTQYYLVTGDERVLDRVEESLDVIRTAYHDPEHDGYYQQVARDLSVADDGKNKHAHYGYVGSHTLNMYLATRDPELLAWQRELCDLSIERQMDDEGWIYGYNSNFDRQWNRIPNVVDGEEVVKIGAQLTAALAFLRLYHQTGADVYREQGMRIAENVNRYGYDERGFFWDTLTRERTEPTDDARVSFWVQNYGCFLQLQQYNITEDETYLQRFRDAERFYVEEMFDREHGGIIPTVDAEGTPVGGTAKATPWDTPYHEVEHGMLASLYLDLYVDGEPATVSFRLGGGESGATHYVSPVDDPRVGIERVTVDGEAWDEFDAEERSVTVPPGEGHAVAVTLSPVPGR
jgi:mannobiose 2-epimerase